MIMQHIELDIKIGNTHYPMIKVMQEKFLMGGQDSGIKDHEEEISKSFFMGKYPVTQEVSQDVMHEQPNNKYLGRLKPVDEVSYEECTTFICKLKEITRLPFDLPTETQWEFAAKGGILSKGYNLSGSNSPEDVMGKNEIDDGYQTVTYDVGLFKPNEIGLYDMTNNLSEWCKTDKSPILKGGLLGYEGGIIWEHCSCAQQLTDYAADSYTPNKGLRLVVNL